MNLLKKCLLEFNNKHTNLITKEEIDEDMKLRFSLLDMQKFAEIYHNKQLTMRDVGCSKRINLMVYEDNTRCYKLTNKELKIYTDNNQIEKGDKHYKCELIKKY